MGCALGYSCGTGTQAIPNPRIHCHRQTSKLNKRPRPALVTDDVQSTFRPSFLVAEGLCLQAALFTFSRSFLLAEGHCLGHCPQALGFYFPSELSCCQRSLSKSTCPPSFLIAEGPRVKVCCASTFPSSCLSAEGIRVELVICEGFDGGHEYKPVTEESVQTLYH